jgi:hypothetical protein
VRKPGGRCPSCNAPVAAFVQGARKREERIERVVAILGTILVVSMFVVTSGLGAIEGVLAYAGAGAVMFYLARKTF